MSTWSGRKVAQLTAQVLQYKGTTCHLCELEGADSPDHEPPRHELVKAGVPNPDALEYLFPSHLLCNKRRQDRPITPALRLELRTRRLGDLDRELAATRLSPRFARRRDELLRPAQDQP